MARPARIPVEEVAEIVRSWPSTRGFTRHIAEQYEVPIGTATRWIQVARQRGLLAPGSEMKRTCRHCGGTGIGKSWPDPRNWLDK